MDKSSIEVKLNNHGRYTWKINILFEKDHRDVIKQIKSIDNELREEFPEYTKKAGGKVYNFEED